MNTTSETKYTKFLAYLLGFISFTLFVYILTALSGFLIPITIAIFLTYLMHPLVEYLRKFKVPRWLSLIAILIFISSIYYLLGMLIVANSSAMAVKLEGYGTRLSEILQAILAPFNITAAELAELYGINVHQFDMHSVFQQLFAAGIIQGIFNSVGALVGDLFIALIFWVFMMMGKNKFEGRLRIAFANSREIIDNSLNSINQQLQLYLIVKTSVSLITGMIVTVILTAYGIDFAIFWGILTFVFNFIPNIGSIVITILPILVGFLEFGIGVKAISLGIVLSVNQNIWGNFVEPHFLGKQMDLSVVFVLFSLIFWGWIWGIAGMFLAVPIAALMKILCANIEPLKPVAVIMGSRTDVSLQEPVKIPDGDK